MPTPRGRRVEDRRRKIVQKQTPLVDNPVGLGARRSSGDVAMLAVDRGSLARSILIVSQVDQTWCRSCDDPGCIQLVCYVFSETHPGLFHGINRCEVCDVPEDRIEEARKLVERYYDERFNSLIALKSQSLSSLHSKENEDNAMV